MEVGNMRLCALSTDSVFVNFFIFENKIQCWKNVRNYVTNTAKNIKNNVTRRIYLEK